MVDFQDLEMGLSLVIVTNGEEVILPRDEWDDIDHFRYNPENPGKYMIWALVKDNEGVIQFGPWNLIGHGTKDRIFADLEMLTGMMKKGDLK